MSYLDRKPSGYISGVAGEYGYARQAYDHRATIVPVVWTNLVNCTATGNTLEKTAGGSAYNAGATSTRIIYGNGYAEYTIDALGVSAKIFGLTNDNPDANWTSIDFAFGVITTTIYAYENGSAVNLSVVPLVGDVMRIERVGTALKLYKNGTKIRDYAASSSLALFVDTSIYTVGDKIADAVISGAS